MGKAYGDPLPKRVELWLRRRLIQGFGRPVHTVRVTEPHLLPGLPENAKILVLRQDKIGDALVSFPVIRTLHEAFPQATIDVLLGDANYAIRHALSPFIRRAWRYSKRPASILRLITALRAEKYDVVVDLMDNPSTTASFLVRNIRSRYAVGIDKENAAVYTHVVPLADRARVHIVERIALLLLPFGIDPARCDLSLSYPLSPEDVALARERMGQRRRPLRLGINISGTGEQKYWGRENFIALITAIQAAHDDVETVVFASPEYEPERHAITRAGGREAPVAAGFHEFAAMLHECDVIVTPDTSVVHLAAAWQTPCVAMFIHADRNLLPWTPYRSPHEAVCTEKPHLAFIPVADVLPAVERMLDTARERVHLHGR